MNWAQLFEVGQDLETGLRGLGVVFLSAAGLALALTPIFHRIAVMTGLVAKPNPLVQSHTKATAYLGGIAVYAAFFVPTLMTAPTNNLFIFLLLTGLMAGWGLLDDRAPFTPMIKLGGQTVISIGALLALGQPSWPWWLYPLLLFWLLLSANALNLVDVMDGLATGLSCIAFVGLAIAAVYSEFHGMALVTSALAGACLGFLPYNWNRASIFLGDAGSLFLGFAIGLTPLLEPQSVLRWGNWSFFTIIFAIPIFEVAFLFIMRTRAGKPFWQGSRDHFALRLHHVGWSIPKIVSATYLAALVFVAAGLAFRGFAAERLMLFPILLVCAALFFAGSMLAKIKI